MMRKKIAIVGGGATGLMAASCINTQKFDVTIYDHKPHAGLKLRLAAKGGFNFTNQLMDSHFYYEHAQQIEPFINQLDSQHLIRFFKNIGLESIEGNSGKMLLNPDYPPKLISNKMVESAQNNGVKFLLNHQLIDFDDKQLYFQHSEQTLDVQADFVIFAMGGASWIETGSDARWVEIFERHNISITPFAPANCEMKCQLTKPENLQQICLPLKNITVAHLDNSTKGEALITPTGIEGQAIYKLGKSIRNELKKNQTTTIYIDLKPEHSAEKITQTFNKHQEKFNTTDILRQHLNIHPSVVQIIKSNTSKELFTNATSIGEIIKRFPITITATGDIKNSISSAGGVNWNEISSQTLALNKYPNYFVAGEMLDWEAPTGGYLLHACFAMGYAIAKHLSEKQNA